jgi:hypothetical protein
MAQRSDICGQAVTVVVDRASQAVRELNVRLPTGELTKAPVVGEVVSDVDSLASWRELALLEAAGARDTDEAPGELGQ